MSWKKYLKQLSFPESYISITLGFLVVIVAGLLFYNYINKGTGIKTGDEKPDAVEKQREEKISNVSLPVTHTVLKDESLWAIAEKYYNSGYNWVSIAKENNLADPGKIEVGQTLKIPKAETIKPVTGEVSVKAMETSKTYVVKKGDYLWDIAVRNYGDGYAWTKIAKANNLANPNIIHSGNVLTIPQ